jgi:superfamily I DNA/RNA helicase/RecB family exonuclease
LPASLEPARGSRGLTEAIRTFIAAAQSSALTPADVAVDEPMSQAAAQIFAEYLDILGLSGGMDYAELIRRTTMLLAERAPESVRGLRTVFVDEYQDTDPAQVEFLRQLASYGAQVIAVGDPDQAIYGFRGADATGILDFPQAFAQPSCRTIALGATRRFGPAIAAVARRIVPHNALTGVAAADVASHRNPEARGAHEGRVAIRLYESEAAQADHIADLLRRVHAGTSEVFPDTHLAWGDMAVLVRSGQRDLPLMQRALLAAGVPTEIARDDIPLALTPSVKPLLDVLRVAADVDGGLTTARATDLLCSPLGGLDSRQLSRLGRVLRRRASSHGRAVPSAQLIVDALNAPDRLDEVEPELARPVADLADILDRAAQSTRDGVATSRLLDQIWRATRWPQRLRRDALRGGRRAREANLALDAVMELFDQAEQMDRAFESARPVAEFLHQLDQQVIPAAPDRQKTWNRDAVRLMTAHRSKGGQWPLVVVAGVQEGLWPDLRPRVNLFAPVQDADPRGWRERQLLEERRLFYVACTRASQALLIAAVNSSTEDGPTPSPFVHLAAGDREVVEVTGRPRRPLTPVGVVAGLRQVLMDDRSSPAMREAVWQRLQRLSKTTDSRGRQIFPWADPQRWWGHRAWTVSEKPWDAPDTPITLSASSVQSYVQCPRRWFLERRAAASGSASTNLAFGNILHLCAQAMAAGELAQDEAEVSRVLDGVWDAVGYEPGWQARYEREQARQATTRLLRWLRETPGEFVGAEVPFDAQWELPSGESLRLVGKMDRVDRDEDQLVITDFKTGKAPTRAEVAEHVQLGLYRWVSELEGLGEGGRAVAQLLFLRQDPPKGQTEPGAKLMRQDTADPDEWLTPVLESVVAGIRAELAVARPGSACRMCAVASSCPADPRGAEVRP